MYVPSLAATPPNEIRSGPNHLAENYAASGSTAKRWTRWSAARERLYGTAVDAATDSAAVELAKDPDTR